MATLSENFNTADQNTPGPQLSWTVSPPSVAWAVRNNQLSMTSTGQVQVARAGNLDTDVHAVEFTLNSLQGAGAWQQASALVRVHATQDTYYALHREVSDTGQHRLRIEKFVNGAGTDLKTQNVTANLPERIRFEVDSSNRLVGYIDDVEMISHVDGSSPITGHTGVGVRGYMGSVTGAVIIDDFYAEDLDDDGEPGDTTPPKVTGLTATVEGSDVTLNWSPASHADAYDIERGGVIITRVYGVTTYVDENLPNGTYSYRVRGVDLDNN